jgi:hypothetical protein
VVIVLEADMISDIEMMYKGVFVGKSYTEIVEWSELRGLGCYMWMRGMLNHKLEPPKKFRRIPMTTCPFLTCYIGYYFEKNAQNNSLNAITVSKISLLVWFLCQECPMLRTRDRGWTSQYKSILL